MSKSDDGSFKPVPEEQTQGLPGYMTRIIWECDTRKLINLFYSLEKDMVPSSETSKLEGKDQHYEYLAAGKLKGNKALITGGEYESPLNTLNDS